MNKIIYLNLCSFIGILSTATALAPDQLFNESALADDALTKRTSCCPPKDSCCTRLQCRSILSKLCLLTECEPYHLSSANAAGGTITINQAGAYYLCSDTTANVSIDASHVLLDLNGYTLTGTIVNTANSTTKITIKNGCLNVPTGQIGITLAHNASNIVIEHVTIANGSSGILLSTGLTAATLSQVFIHDAANNGFDIQTDNVKILNSTSTANANGFVLTTGQNSLLQNCSAIANRNNGFTLTGNTGLVVQQCQAINNAQYGFQDSVGFGSTNAYISNYATGNVTANYNPAAGAPFNPFAATSAGISHWYNTFS